MIAVDIKNRENDKEKSKLDSKIPISYIQT